MELQVTHSLDQVGVMEARSFCFITFYVICNFSILFALELSKIVQLSVGFLGML